MLEKWLKDPSALESITLTGDFWHRPVPASVYGMISALLLRSDEIGEDIRDELESIDFPLPAAPYRVILFSLDDPNISALSGHDRHSCRINMYDALRTYLASRFAVSCQSMMVLVNGYLIVLVYSDEFDTVPAICGDAVTYAKETLGFDVHVTLSTVLSSIVNLSSGYSMDSDFERCRCFYGEKAPRAYIKPEIAAAKTSDPEQRTQFEQTFFQTAERICGAVRAGDVESTADFIDDQLTKIADNCLGMPYPLAVNNTVNRFMTLLQYRLADQDLAEWRYIAQIDLSRELAATKNYEQYLATGRSIAKTLVEHSRDRSLNRHDMLMRDIRDFVEKNATDVNMGLACVAREFKIKPREAAESFRAYFGESINDVMHKARVSRAKELLLTTNESVQDIATEVGYCSLATMYRAFTNVEGVAPGRLRQGK